jgi:hypothetical protein
MDAYILGTHEGDLPTHLLEGGEVGNRVRAMAQLDGPDHNVFYAIEGPDQATVDAHVRSIVAAGTTVQHAITPDDGRTNDPEWVMIGVSHPSHKPPWEYYIFWRLLHYGDPVEYTGALAEGLGAARDLVGDDRIAVAINAEGDVLIELCGDDQAALVEAQAALEEHFGDNLPGGHTVTGAGIVTA